MTNTSFREEALNLVREKLKNVNLQRHCFAVEAIMKALARRFGEPEENWGLAGLLHDVDYEETQKDLGQHSLLAANWLEERDFPSEVVRAVKIHNEIHSFPLETKMEKCLTFADAISGLIVAAALVLPSKKITDLKTENVLKRFKEPSFARGVSREEILRCEQQGLSLEEFADIAIKALQEIASDLGL